MSPVFHLQILTPQQTEKAINQFSRGHFHLRQMLVALRVHQRDGMKYPELSWSVKITEKEKRIFESIRGVDKEK